VTESDLLVVADDLTGAADTGHEFAARGHDTVVVGHEGDPPDAAPTVLVIDTDSRETGAATAAERVRAAAGRPAAGVYKKLDSTLRGNVVAELDALVAARGLDACVVAPAFPATGRITAGGYHLVDGTPVDGADVAAGPAAPASAHLPSLLEPSEHPVVHLPLGVVAGGAAAVADRVAGAAADAGRPVLVAADATASDHLDAVAGGLAALGERGLAVGAAGSAGLAAHLRVGASRRRVLGIVGSTHPTTLAALSALEDDRVIALDPEGVVTDTDRAVERAVGATADALENEETAVLTAARSPADVKTTLAAGRAAGLEATAVRERVATTLGRVAVGVHDAGGLTGLFLTGGATAGAVLSALGASGLQPAGRSVAAGVPLATVVGGAAAGVPAVTKAGGFGDRSTIVNCLRTLARTDE